jgi:hypothetical protein
VEAATVVPHEIEIRNFIASNRKSHGTHARRIYIAWGKGLVPLMQIRVSGSWPVDPVRYYRAGITSNVDFRMYGTERELVITVLAGS